MYIESVVEISAPPERVWDVLKEVERWPEWTQSISRIDLLDTDDLVVGARARIKQPRLPAVIWKVTELTPGRSFAWVASGLGYETVATHAIEPSETGSKVTLTVKQTGLLSHLMPWVSAMSRRYVEMEARGLKQRIESRVRAA
ncbi:MAG TPA: SRPBCC family protein [Dehalococcoidia bacterium]|nr:SRPBCC family protein [Dehalococcoidia bacterium]